MPDLERYTLLENVDVGGAHEVRASIAPFKAGSDSINEIIVKIEMKKF